MSTLVRRSGGAAALFDDDRDADAHAAWLRPQTTDVLTLESCAHGTAGLDDMDETIEAAEADAVEAGVARDDAQREADGLRAELETEREEHRALLGKVKAALGVLRYEDDTPYENTGAIIEKARQALIGAAE